LQPITCGKYTVEGVKKSVVRGWELDSTPYIYIYILSLYQNISKNESEI
jgi:hypothetical protein